MVLMAVFAPAASGVTEQAQVSLTETVDENWRGAYDILVRPEGARSALEERLNLVEPNFLMFSGEGGISGDQVEEVREVEGVEVAAPISMVGYLSLQQSTPVVYLGSSEIPDQPTLYRLNVEVSTSDGYSEEILDEQTHHIVLLPEDERGERRWYSGRGATVLDQGTMVDFDPIPAVASPMVAVDPDAERQLIGSSANFLEVFEAIGDQREVRSFPVDLIDEESRFRLELQFVRQTDGPDLPVIPMLTSEVFYAPLRASMSVEQLGAPIDDHPDVDGYGYLDAVMNLREDAEPIPTGSVSIDESDDLRPFELTSLVLEWPGAELPDRTTYRAGHFVQEFVAAQPQPLMFEERAPREGSEAVSFEAVPTGEGFRSLESTEVGEAPDLVATPSDYPFLLAPVGDYDLEDLELPDNPLNWVPIGAYEPPDTRLVADPSGDPVDPVSMNPTFDPAGLLQPPPLAITDIVSAEILRGDAPIDAIRVRVDGIGGFDAAAQAKVEEVAGSIRALGLDVDIVAGSSPQPVELYWPSYHPDGSDLGWVEQGWSTLGAAQEVTSGLGDLNRSILVVAVVAAVAGIVGLQVTGSALRRREADVLSTVGWTRRRIVWWLSSDGVVGALLVTAVGAAVNLALGLEEEAMAVVLVVAAVLGGSSIVGSLRTVHRSRRNQQKASDIRIASTPRPEGMIAYALRALLGRPVSSVAAVVSLAVAAGGLSLIVVSTAGAVSEAGPTLLAEFGAARLQGYQIAMLVITAVAGVGTYLLLAGHEISSRRGELAALRSIGLRTKTIRGLLLRQRFMIGVGSALVAALIGYGFVTGEAASLAAAFLAAAIALATAVWPTPRRHVSKQ